MSRMVRAALCGLALAATLGGCRKDPGDISKLSRGEQEKAFAGDPVRGQEVGRQMEEKYMKNPPVPPSGQPGPPASGR